MNLSKRVKAIDSTIRIGKRIDKYKNELFDLLLKPEDLTPTEELRVHKLQYLVKRWRYILSNQLNKLV